MHIILRPSRFITVGTRWRGKRFACRSARRIDSASTFSCDFLTTRPAGYPHECLVRLALNLSSALPAVSAAALTELRNLLAAVRASPPYGSICHWRRHRRRRYRHTKPNNSFAPWRNYCWAPRTKGSPQQQPEVRMNPKLTDERWSRRAIVYVRQSSPGQVLHN
jgi:hypothetical protein